mmetsp:Transcript_5442/g.13430  ORF Transcript_5442/g.13430 Transcript_5442/m.13430 type:complete len:92 (+) Transcript_5442:175-450(+)
MIQADERKETNEKKTEFDSCRRYSLRSLTRAVITASFATVFEWFRTLFWSFPCQREDRMTANHGFHPRKSAKLVLKFEKQFQSKEQKETCL